MEPASKRMKVNFRHWDLLLNILEEHPEMITGKFNCQNAKQRITQLWEEAAFQLNALGLGEKTADKWKIAVQDWKYKTKIKIAEKEGHEKKTGGGPSSNIKLSEQEERLMKIVGWTSVLGNPNVPESGVKITQQSPQIMEFETSKFGSEFEIIEIIADTPGKPSDETSNVQSEQQFTPKSGNKIRKETTFKKRNINDPLETFQKETMEVLNDSATG